MYRTTVVRGQHTGTQLDPQSGASMSLGGHRWLCHTSNQWCAAVCCGVDVCTVAADPPATPSPPDGESPTALSTWEVLAGCEPCAPGCFHPLAAAHHFCHGAHLIYRLIGARWHDAAQYPVLPCMCCAVSGCSCRDSWTFDGEELLGCSDVLGPWPACVISGQCSTAAGQTQLSTPPGQSWRYCTHADRPQDSGGTSGVAS